MISDSQFEPYRIHEKTWKSYEELIDTFEWTVPETFNAAAYLCDRWAETDGGNIAVYATNTAGEKRTLTYSELREKADRLANYLKSEGVGEGDRVGISGPQKPETVISFIATWKLGGIAMPLSALFGTEGLRYRLRDAEAAAYVVDESAIDTFRKIQPNVELDSVLTVDCEPLGAEREFHEAISDGHPALETPETDPEDPATILYTSGTTGEPKGVLHAHRYVLGTLPAHLMEQKNLTVRENDVSFSPVEWTWGASLYMNLFPNLFLGTPVVAFSRRSFEPEHAIRIVDEYDVTIFNAPRTVLRMLRQVNAIDEYDLSSVRVIPSGGESLDRNVREWIQDTFEGVHIHEAYGQTEALPLVGSCNSLFDPKEGMIGRPFPGQDIRILDPDTREPVETGEIGEIATSYEGNLACFKEYWNEKEKTEEKVVDGWLLTEDLGWIDEDGYVAFHSRKDEVIISSGYRIGPKEIEGSLADHPIVEDTAVVGVPDEERGEVPKAFVVPTEAVRTEADTKEELQSFVKQRLAKYEYPRRIEFVDELPKTSTGKIRRSALKNE